MKAYWVIWNLDADTKTVYGAPTAGKARYRFLCDLRDGYPAAKFQEIKVRRAPEYDKAVQDFVQPRSLGWTNHRTGEGHGLLHNSFSGEQP